MNIRRMTISDYNGVYQLCANTPGMGLNNLDDSYDGIERYLKRNPTTCFVAVSGDEEIIGVILCGHDGRRGFIHHTAVKVSERKQGIGSALVNAALQGLQEEGIVKVALVVFTVNEVGNDFWEKHGFISREDLIYRNKTLNENLVRIDT